MPVIRFQFRKGRLIENPVGEYVALPWKGRTLLGEVRAVEYIETRGVFELTVRHFNGELWPIKPICSAVEVIR